MNLAQYIEQKIKDKLVICCWLVHPTNRIIEDVPNNITQEQFEQLCQISGILIDDIYIERNSVLPLLSNTLSARLRSSTWEHRFNGVVDGTQACKLSDKVVIDSIVCNWKEFVDLYHLNNDSSDGFVS